MKVKLSKEGKERLLRLRLTGLIRRYRVLESILPLMDSPDYKDFLVLMKKMSKYMRKISEELNDKTR